MATGVCPRARDPVVGMTPLSRKVLMRLAWPGSPPPWPVRSAAKLFQHGGRAEDTVTTEEQKRPASTEAGPRGDGGHPPGVAR